MLRAAIAAISVLTAAAHAALVQSTITTRLNGGWSVTLDISYDDAVTAPSATEGGPTNGIESLNVSFFNPGGSLVYTVDNVAAGISSNNFLQIELDPTTGTPAPGTQIDIGAENPTPGQFYLLGRVGATATIVDDDLVEVDRTTQLTFTPGNGPRRSELCYDIALDGGHRVTGTLVYNPDLPIVVAELLGPTQGIGYLDVNVFDPTGALVVSVVNVAEGVSSYRFLALQFDTNLQNLVPGSTFDIGQDTPSPGDHALFGNEGASAELSVIQANLSRTTIDQTDAATFTFTTKNPSCTPADIAAPFGVLDLADIDAFVLAFLANDPLADVAPPAGIIDLADIDAFIAAFLAGCP